MGLLLARQLGLLLGFRSEWLLFLYTEVEGVPGCLFEWLCLEVGKLRRCCGQLRSVPVFDQL
jgi:hypothetical protein